jgi:hypothetical protein
LPVRNRRLALLSRPTTWLNLGRDLAWRLSPRSPHPPPVPLSWPLEPEIVQNIVVRWPVQYGWKHAERWVDPVLYGLQQLVKIDFAEINQPPGNIVVFEFVLGGVPLEVGIDHEDRPEDLHPAVADLALVFKMQHLREGYGRRNVVPGGFVTMRHEMYRLFPRFREFRRRSRPECDVYGRFSLDFSPEYRSRAVALLQEQDEFCFKGGLRHSVNWSQYIRDACRTRLCLELPGRGMGFSSRPIDLLAIGACIVAPRAPTELHVPLVSGEHVVYARQDLSDLVAVCKRYLADGGARARISASACDFFDRYLRPEQLAAYYLHACLRLTA